MSRRARAAVIASVLPPLLPRKDSSPAIIPMIFTYGRCCATRYSATRFTREGIRYMRERYAERRGAARHASARGARGPPPFTTMHARNARVPEMPPQRARRAAGAIERENRRKPGALKMRCWLRRRYSGCFVGANNAARQRRQRYGGASSAIALTAPWQLRASCARRCAVRETLGAAAPRRTRRQRASKPRNSALRHATPRLRHV